MPDLKGARIVIAGAGALGAAIAFELADAGAAVLVADPAALADNASGVAAGMLAPAMECALDDDGPGDFGLLLQARDAWTPFLDRLGAAGAADRSGAIWLGSPAAQGARLSALRAFGARAEAVSGREAQALSPGLAATDGGLFTPEDWRIDPSALLQAMRGAFLARGGRITNAAVAGVRGGEARLDDASAELADWVVFAGGHPSARSLSLAPELGRLQPIKGQILKFHAGGPATGPTVRGEGIYIAPGSGGPAVGATMEPGLADRRVDPAAAARLRAAAGALYEPLATAPATAQAAVRSATPDGWPLVGPSAAAGVMLATGARRNGWLLAPLIARLVLGLIAGDAQPPLAATFRPGRFND
jgi:glycine oxidase